MHARAPIHLQGMLGIGDNLMHIAVLRELMKTHEVTLDASYVTMFRHLERDGLRLNYVPRTYSAGLEPGEHQTRLHGRGANYRRISYSPEMIRRAGSILAAQFEAVGLTMPERPDISVPVPPRWRSMEGSPRWKSKSPIAIYRPLVRSKVWDRPSRLPDVDAYRELFRKVQERYYTISICKLGPSETLHGEMPDVDLKLHDGMSFRAMAALFADADLVFGCPGFSPVLAHAVGTPVICTYGGNESSATTQRPMRHMAPSLYVEPVSPCDCHNWQHQCDKRIDVPMQIERVEQFLADVKSVRTLLYGTCWVDSEHRLACVERWCRLHSALNPRCDLLMIDSASPMANQVRAICAKHGVDYFSFPDNVGHLSRKIGGVVPGRDGWGRAYSEGLMLAQQVSYDYAVHIEGDSLCRLDVAAIARQMRADGTKFLAPMVKGTRNEETNWIETGLTFVDVAYSAQKRIVEQYDWPTRSVAPTPEHVLWRIVKDNLKIAPWSALRGDKNQVTPDNVAALDWVTHCWDKDEVYEAFIKSILGEPDHPRPVPQSRISGKVMVNFGCGTNRLPGWNNHDKEVSIERRLPYQDNSVDFILAEHVVEHTDWSKAINFMRECHRILKRGGVARIAVPSVVQIMEKATDDYLKFTTNFTKEKNPTKRSAIAAILYHHGHQMPWCEELLRCLMFFVGFEDVVPMRPGESFVPELSGVDGHGKVIGEAFNAIETVICEGQKR